jgi:hypothetical protein
MKAVGEVVFLPAVGDTLLANDGGLLEMVRYGHSLAEPWVHERVAPKVLLRGVTHYAHWNRVATKNGNEPRASATDAIASHP